MRVTVQLQHVVQYHHLAPAKVTIGQAYAVSLCPRSWHGPAACLLAQNWPIAQGVSACPSPNNRCPSRAHPSAAPKQAPIRKHMQQSSNKRVKVRTHSVKLLQLCFVHLCQLLLRKRTKQQVALKRAALAGLVYQSRSESLDALTMSRKWLRRRRVWRRGR